MALAVDIRPHGRLARALVERMNQQDLTIRQLAQRTGLTYEHIRKLAKGEAHPSRLALQELCRALQLEPARWETLAVADRIEKKYGGIPHALAGHHPELSLLAPWWDVLTEEQKEFFRIEIRSVAEANRQQLSRKPARGTALAAPTARRSRR
ncbi:MAG TPA: helix-turn-helix transcriptional regulator [Terriglobales bacterium]|jgi:transcriptional regulator with XRE-family HTH domain|nr:helix-turn-helix transcriptional regulator [Terriglobales bacterium]